MVTTDRRYDPREAVVDQYDALYGFFSSAREGLQPVWSERAAVYDRSITGERG